MTGFFSSNSGGITPAPVVPEATDTGFFPSGGTPTLLDTPFDGVLKASTAHIGNVSIDNFPGSFAISNLPGTQRVEVANWPALQRVALDFPAVQAVSLDFPAVQAVTGAVSVTNFPAVQDVKIVGSSGLLAGLTAGTQHVGSVSIDGPITGTVTITNPTTTVAVTNLPETQAVTGTVAISNLPAPLTSIKVNNDAGSPVPVQIVSGTTGNTVQAVSGNVGLKAGTAHVGSVSLDEPVALQSGTTVGISSLPPVAITGPVTVANPVTSVAVSSIPSITGTVSVANPVTSISINNAPGAPVPVAHQGPVALASGSTVAVSSIPPVTGTVSIAGTPTVALANSTVSVAGMVKLDDTTAIRVEVTNPSSGGGGSTTFDGNVTLKAGTAHIGNVGVDGPVTVAGTLNLFGWDGVTQSTPANHLPVGLYDQSGHLIGVDANPLPVRSTGVSVVDVKGYGGYKLSEGGGIVLIGRDERTTVTPSNHVPIGLYTATGQALGVAVPLTVQGTVTANVAFPATQAVSITGTPTVAVSGTVAVAQSGPVAVNTSSGVATSDRSGTITTGSAAQVLAVADATRKGAWVQNNSTGDLWVSDVGTATIGGSSLRIPAGVLYEWPSHGIPTSAISIIGATTGQAFAARVW